MYQEETFVDDIQFSNAVGGSQLQDLREGAGNRTSLVGIELLNQRNTMGQLIKKAIPTKRIKEMLRLNTLFGRLKYETNSVQRDAIIKEIESVRNTLKESIIDFDKIDDPKLLSQLFVDLSKPIKFVGFQEYMSISNIPIKVGTEKKILYLKDIPVNIDASTKPLPPIAPIGGGGAVVGGGGAGRGDGIGDGTDGTTDEVKETKETEKKPSNTKFILLGLGGLALVYYFFIRKKS